MLAPNVIEARCFLDETRFAFEHGRRTDKQSNRSIRLESTSAARRPIRACSSRATAFALVAIIVVANAAAKRAAAAQSSLNESKHILRSNPMDGHHHHQQPLSEHEKVQRLLREGWAKNSLRAAAPARAEQTSGSGAAWRPNWKTSTHKRRGAAAALFTF